MEILQIMFSRGRGGLERVFLDHAELLSRRGHRVHCLIACGADCSASLQAMADRGPQNLVIHRLPAHGWQRLLLMGRLWRLLRVIRPQVLIAHGAKAASRLSLLRPRGVPLVAVTHNDSPRLLRATHLIVLTRRLLALYRERGFAAERMTQIPNPSPVAPGRRRARPAADPAAMLRVGTISRLVGKKGIDVFLRGLRLALDRGLPVQGLIAGDGEQRAALEALADRLDLRRHLVFTGWLDDPAPFYEGIDWLCIPSRDEPFGLVALEAYAHGVPVIAAAVGGLCEIIEHEVSGLLFAPDDPQTLADALMRIQDPGLAERLREAGYGALPRYAPERISAEIETALLDAIGTLKSESRGRR